MHAHQSHLFGFQQRNSRFEVDRPPSTNYIIAIRRITAGISLVKAYRYKRGIEKMSKFQLQGLVGKDHFDELSVVDLVPLDVHPFQ